MTTTFEPPPTPPEAAPQTAQYPMQPHRGPVVLVLGILGLVMCFVLGIVAWAMGNNDLREMDGSRMDPAGRSLTNAGRICGIVSVCLAFVGAAFIALAVIIPVLMRGFLR